MVAQLIYNQVVGSRIDRAPQFTGQAFNMFMQMISRPSAPVSDFTTLIQEPKTATTEAYQLQPGDTIISQEQILAYRQMVFQFWGNAYTRKDWLNLAMGQNGQPVDAYIQARYNTDVSISRKLTGLFMDNIFAPQLEMPVQLEAGAALGQVIPFPTGNVITKYASTAIDVDFTEVPRELFQNAGLADDGGPIIIIAPRSVMYAYYKSMGITYTSAILDMGVENGITDDSRNYGWYMDKTSGIHWFILPPVFFKKGGTGSGAYWRLPVFMPRAFLLSADITFAQEVPQLDKWFNPHTFAMGRKFGMNRMYDELCYEYQVNINANRVIG